jgi:allophanate hydrolase subunit 2
LPPQITTGAIQVPGNRQPIVRLADQQTIGGYTKLGTVASVDLPRLSRHRPGQQLRFMPIEAAAAETQRRVQQEVRNIPLPRGSLDPVRDHSPLRSS